MAQDTETKLPQEQDRGATRRAGDAALTATARMQDAARLGGDAARRSGEAGSETLRHLGDATGETARRVAHETARAEEELVHNAATQFEATVGKLAEAMQDSAQNWRALMQLPTLSSGRLADLNTCLSGAVERVVHTNLLATQELFRIASPVAIAELQHRFMREYLGALLEGTTAVVRAVHRSAEQSLEPLEQRLAQRQHRSNGNGTQHGERVADVMQRHVQIASPEDSVQQAARLMRESDVGVLPVGEGDRLIGMVTDRDVAVRVAAEGRDPARTKVREVMSEDVRYVFEDEEVEHVAENMAQQQVRRLPVMNRQKRLVGVISLGDIAKGQRPHLAGQALRGVAREQGQLTQQAAAE